MVTWANERNFNCSKTSRTDEVFTENSNIDKTNVLDMDAKIDMVNFKGVAKYLNDVKTSNSQFGFVLKYETTTAIKQINFEHRGNGKAQYSKVFDPDMANDVVFEILCGLQAFIVFHKELSKDESVRNLNERLKIW